MGWQVLGHTGEERQENKVQPAEREGSATPILSHPQAREVPGVKVFRSSATMCFANAELYSDALKQRVRPGSPRRVSEGPSPPQSAHISCPDICLQCGVDVDHLISQKKKLLRKQELKLKRMQKEKLKKQAGAPSSQ